MIDEMQGLLNKYWTWLRDKTTLRELKDWVEITTPYLDRHNDYLQIYAKRENGGWLLTDDGYVIEDLEQSGCTLDSPKRQQLLRMTLNGFGVQLQGDELRVRATPENFPMRKHNLIQAILAVNDLFYLASPVVASLFLEDVMAWLDLREIRYTPKLKFTGQSGYDHVFDFVIPKSRLQPERIIRAINHPDRDTAQALVFAWMDTREVRAADARAYAFLNDTERAIAAAVLEALRSYDVTTVPWSRREEFQAALAA